ncbi:MAG: hypothetical protein WBN75_20965 [Verrucomicrobiia bacterium]|jgi:hypothetical protein
MAKATSDAHTRVTQRLFIQFQALADLLNLGRPKHCKEYSISVKADNLQFSGLFCPVHGATAGFRLAGGAGDISGTNQAKPILKICLQLFGEWLKLIRLLDNLSFQGMENLQVNVVQ